MTGVKTMQAVCAVTDIPEEGAKGFEVNGQKLVGVKKDGAVHLYLNECPHLRVNLEWLPDEFLDADGQLLQCATHGALFLMDTGECIQGPCQGQSLKRVDYVLDGEQVLASL